jgi:hypothetical protein
MHKVTLKGKERNTSKKKLQQNRHRKKRWTTLL